MKIGMACDFEFGRKGVAIIVVLIIAMQLLRMNDNMHLSLFFSTVCLACVGIIPLQKLTKLDIAVCLVTGYEMLSLLWAECPRASLNIAAYGLRNLNIYFVVRKLSSYEDAKHIVISGTCMTFFVVLFLGLWSFFMFERSAHATGFNDLYHLRFLFTPLGYQVNVWAELLIVMIGWGLMSRNFCYPLVFIGILSLLLSFSRAGYISLILFLSLIVVFTRDKTRKKGLVILFFMASILIMGFFHKEMTTTLKLNHTISQRYSTESRVTATSAAIAAFKKRPLVGYGSNNFTYAVDHNIYEDSRKAFSSLAPNVFSQLIVERGFIGTLLYGFLIVSFFAFLWKNKDSEENRIMLCLAITLVIKEMGQSTMLNCSATMILVTVLLGFLQKDRGVLLQSRIPVYMLASASTICLILWNIPNIIYRIDETASMVKTALAFVEEYKRTGKRSLLYMAKAGLMKSSGKHMDDVSMQYLIAHITLLEGNKKNAYDILNELTASYPDNAMILLKMSELQYYNGEKDLALKFVCKAVTLMPQLLRSETICKWEKSDKKFYIKITKRLSTMKPSANASPTELARYGYIALWCKKPKGYIYLRHAVSQMPSLATPWKLLGDIPKYNLLTRGAFQRVSSLQNVFEESPTTAITDKQIFLYHYRHKFNLWYGEDLK